MHVRLLIKCAVVISIFGQQLSLRRAPSGGEGSHLVHCFEIKPLQIIFRKRKEKTIERKGGEGMEWGGE
jgi:hypothetical protein